MNRTCRLMFLPLCLALSTAAVAEEKQNAPMPWHLVDLWWDIGRDVPFESYSIDVTIGDDVSASTKSNLHFAMATVSNT